jgi:hypothetical protein
MATVETEVKKGTRGIEGIEIVGLVLVAAALLGLFLAPEKIAGVFDAMVNNAFVIFRVFIFGGSVGIAIIVSVMVGRILERLGFTDALMRIFVPIMKRFGLNSAVIQHPGGHQRRWPDRRSDPGQG